jgi:hypothetical protein
LTFSSSSLIFPGIINEEVENVSDHGDAPGNISDEDENVNDEDENVNDEINNNDTY